MSRLNKLTALAAAVALSVGLAACGGGGGSTTATPDPMPPAPATVDMSMVTTDDAGYMAPTAGRLVIVAGMSETSGDVTFTCASGGEDCEVTIAADGTATSTGGMVTAANSQAYAGRLADAAETQRQMDVAMARSNAMESYMAADGHATMADTAATAAETTAPGSQGAMDAREAATAARMAADAAKAAHDAIMDGMSKADADAQAAIAATEAGKANTAYMTAKAENDAIQTARIIGEEQQEQRDIMAAQEAAKTAAEAAMGHYMAAMGKATDARAQATMARASANMAMAGRTDYENANKYAMMAEMAADAAETARDAAKAASDAAQAAYMMAMGADNSDDAEMHQATAEAQNVIATANHTGADGAGMNYMAAKDAAMKAAEAAGMHVLRLFLAANGAHVEDDEDTTADETAAHVASVGAAMAAIAAAADGNQTAGTTVTITHPGDTVDNPATDADEFSEGMRAITVNVAGTTAIVAELRASRDATDLNNDGDTTDDGEAAIMQTARMIDNLGDFQGYELWENDEDADTDTDRARAILFTDKQKGDDSVLAVTAATARSVRNHAVATDGSELAKVTSTGTTITGVEWTPSGDTAPLVGTLSCPTDSACSITLGADGAVTAIAGYTFTGSRAAREAVTAADAAEDNDYLAFGLWLEESDDGATDTFGSFAVGGTDYAVNVQNAVTGTATYSGVAAGAHHKTGEGVNWFHGDAMLTANFGAIDTDAERGTDPPADTSAGTISGEISNIRVNGGPAMSESIVLRQADLTDGTATFNGNARMGAGEIQADDTVEYPYNGTWSGSFYGATADDTETDVNESVTAPLAAAGTFGVSMSEGTGDDMVVESFVGAFGAHLDD